MVILLWVVLPIQTVQESYRFLFWILLPRGETPVDYESVCKGRTKCCRQVVELERLASAASLALPERGQPGQPSTSGRSLTEQVLPPPVIFSAVNSPCLIWIQRAAELLIQPVSVSDSDSGLDSCTSRGCIFIEGQDPV
jgi:hypothetical protein